jgi:flavin reductase (DIM6/NTAB) family NADH-FMN oxidoreductase RutF
MKEIPYDAYIQEATRVLEEGAFLTVKAEDELNTMTIGWGSIGYVWGRPMFMVMVRPSRYTYQLIEEAEDFTVSLPLGGGMKEALNFCGTKSGRDYDKFAECNLSTLPGKNVTTPVIEGCDLHYECKIKYKQQMGKDKLDSEITTQSYPEGDYHTLYYGEIVGCYIDE